MNKHHKILFTSTFSTPFIQSDLLFFSKRFPTTVIIQSGISALLKYLKNITACTITFSWFASTYASFLVFMANILHKKSVMVIGGVDVARIPEFNYGIWNSRWKAVFVGYGIRNADKVLAVDASIKSDAARLANYDGANIEIVPTGFDHTVWMPASKKENFVLTVAHCTEQNRGMIKGLDFLASIAGAMPDVRFVLIGMSKTISKAFPFTENVELYQYLPQNQLVEFYQRSKIYLQPSRREGLPNSLCEAMLCECFPIGTDVGGIPSAIGKTGAIIPFNDLNGAVKAITQGLVRDRCSDARTQIVNNFSIEKREASLLSIIDKLSHG